ncbi:hypothetical protein GQ44DRAFT_749417 [Phaeosphaeriaceae sp. PMI808]|nr:hypothetical protein GQ44DRAFT_749417 [Phaeosphaeriaceae sp. PMI808]
MATRSSGLNRSSSEAASTAPTSTAPSSTTPSDQKPREVKSAPYQDARYETLLATKGSFMGKPALAITQTSKANCLHLLEARQPIPKDSLFCDELFEETCEMIRNKNEARVIRDILAESVNEGWNNSFPLTGTRPQPDFSMRFRWEAFTNDMTLAVRALVELFRLVGREMELYWEILAFPISHDHRSVRIYGNYPVIDGKDTKYYRHLINTFDFTALDEREKWTAYKFTKNVYDVWMPSHFERLCSAADQIPADLDFSVPQLSQSFGLSQDLERHHLSGSSQPDSQSQGNSQQNTGGARDTTPDTSFTGRGVSKRARKRLAEGE